jgi:hypothetical protein
MGALRRRQVVPQRAKGKQGTSWRNAYVCREKRGCYERTVEPIEGAYPDRRRCLSVEGVKLGAKDRANARMEKGTSPLAQWKEAHTRTLAPYIKGAGDI